MMTFNDSHSLEWAKYNEYYLRDNWDAVAVSYLNYCLQQLWIFTAAALKSVHVFFNYYYYFAVHKNDEDFWFVRRYSVELQDTAEGEGCSSQAYE